MNARAVFVSLLIAVTASLIPHAASAGAWLPAPGEHYSEFRTSVFSADSYYGTDGFRRPLVGGGLSEERSLLSYNEIGWKKKVSFILAAPVVSVTRRTGDGEYDRTETGLGDMQMGLRFKLADGPTALALEVDFDAPLGYRQTFALRDTLGQHFTILGDSVSGKVAAVAELPPILGHGAQDLTGLLQLGRPLGTRGFLEVEGGYRYRFSYEQLSSQIVANVDVGLWFGPSLMIGGRYRGSFATGKAPIEAGKVTENLSGALLVYRVDDRMDVFVGSYHSGPAKNALHVDQIYVGLAVKQTRLNRLQGILGNKHNP